MLILLSVKMCLTEFVPIFFFKYTMAEGAFPYAALHV